MFDDAIQWVSGFIRFCLEGKINFCRLRRDLDGISMYIRYIHFLSVSVRRYTFLLAFSNRRFLIYFGQRTQKTVDGYGWDHTDHTDSMVMLIHFLRIPTRSTVGMTEGCGAKFWLRYGEIRYWWCRHQMGI